MIQKSGGHLIAKSILEISMHSFNYYFLRLRAAPVAYSQGLGHQLLSKECWGREKLDKVRNGIKFSLIYTAKNLLTCWLL